MKQRRMLRVIGVGASSLACLANIGCVDVALWGLGTAISYEQRERHQQEQRIRLDEMSRKIDDLKERQTGVPENSTDKNYSAQRAVFKPYSEQPAEKSPLSLYVCKEWRDANTNGLLEDGELIGAENLPVYQHPIAIDKNSEQVLVHPEATKLSFILNANEKLGKKISFDLYDSRGKNKIYSFIHDIDDPSEKVFTAVFNEGLPRGAYRGRVSFDNNLEGKFILYVIKTP